MAFEVGPGLAVITGPNGAGKSNLGRCLELGRAVIGKTAGDPSWDRLGLYDDAGYQGAESFTVRLALELDQPWERALVRAFVCAGFASGSSSRGAPGSPSDSQLDELAKHWITEDSVAPLLSGTLMVHRDSGMPMPWLAAWEFADGGEYWHVPLYGAFGSYQLRAGLADPSGEATSASHMTDWLLHGSMPEESPTIDFRAKLHELEPGKPVSFYVPTLTAGSKPVPGSLRELASGLGTADYHNKTFGFDELLSVVLQRGIMLTDNRRLPLARRFSQEDLAGPVDLRDGAGVGAELFRLKNGDVRQQERFTEITATFRDLTRRQLGLRAHPAPSDAHGAGMIVEPTVVDGHGERPIEFAGAGVQEALVLSALLNEQPGRVTVLDEPAVNLEPTTQRRLISRLRGPGQYLVITHSADLVPVDQAGDIARIRRVAPGPSGSVVRRPEFGDIATKEAFRWMRLLEPAHTRGLLFAAAVILCEGPTEVAVLPRWWRHTSTLGLRDPEAANIPIIGVGGDSGFGAYVRYLDAFGVPWAVIADGPALRRGSNLENQLAAMGRLPDAPGDSASDFLRRRDWWQSHGVFTLAEGYGDNGSKEGEIEAFLGRVDADLLSRARTEMGKKNKPLVGAYFAAEHPEPPAEVLSLYQKIAAWLDPWQRWTTTRDR